MASCIRYLSTSQSLSRLFSNSGRGNVSKMISGAYLNVPCRFNSRFSGRIWCIKKDLLFRIGSGILLASGFCYIYIRSPSSIVQCDHSHLHINQVNHIPPEGKITLDEAITFAKDLIERKKVSTKYRFEFDYEFNLKTSQHEFLPSEVPISAERNVLLGKLFSFYTISHLFVYRIFINNKAVC